MPKTLTKQHIRAMQEGRVRARKERPQKLREVELKMEQASEQHRVEPDPAKRAEIIREIRRLGEERTRLQRAT